MPVQPAPAPLHARGSGFNNCGESPKTIALPASRNTPLSNVIKIQYSPVIRNFLQGVFRAMKQLLQRSGSIRFNYTENLFEFQSLEVMLRIVQLMGSTERLKGRRLISLSNSSMDTAGQSDGIVPQSQSTAVVRVSMFTGTVQC